MSKLAVEKLNQLLISTEDIQRGNRKLDSCVSQAKMLIRKFFGDNSPYLKQIESISYTPGIWSTSTPESVFTKAYMGGVEHFKIVIRTAISEAELDVDSNNTDINSLERIDKEVDSVFIVHGHNEEMKQAVARFIDKLKLKSIILHEQADRGQTIIEKFEAHSNEVAFAVVIMSADDMGRSKSKSSSDDRPRARQNVIFELGYFAAKLGRGHVFALRDKVQGFEMPTDYAGIIYGEYLSGSSDWQLKLGREMKEAGLDVDMNNI